jgi:hypothetical protein
LPPQKKRGNLHPLTLKFKKIENQLSGWWKGWRVPGTHIPNYIVAGTYFKNHKRTFWDVSSSDHTISIELEDSAYDNLIIDVENPNEAIRLLQF